jgi:hypothetical protein
MNNKAYYFDLNNNNVEMDLTTLEFEKLNGYHSE